MNSAGTVTGHSSELCEVRLLRYCKNYAFDYHFQFFKVVILQLPFQRGSTTPTYYNTTFHCSLGVTTPRITVDYYGIPMRWRHVGILLFKTPTLCWMWSSGALIEVSDL